MGKVKIIPLRLNPDKEIDKRIIDYLDKAIIPKTSLIKMALLHEIEKFREQGSPYVLEEKKNSSTETADKDRLENKFSAFSDKDI